MYYNLHIHISQ